MWNYRIIKFRTKRGKPSDEHYHGLFETFYNDAGEICAHDETPTIVGDSVEDIRKTLSMMTADAIRFEVIDGDKIKFKEFDESGETYEVDLEQMDE
jgi:hypothetical protein